MYVIYIYLYLFFRIGMRMYVCMYVCISESMYVGMNEYFFLYFWKVCVSICC